MSLKLSSVHQNGLVWGNLLHSMKAIPTLLYSFHAIGPILIFCFQLKSMSVQRRVYSCRYSTFSAILLNFKVLYLELQSEDHPKFRIWRKYNYSFDWYIILLSLGKNWHQKIVWMWSKMTVIRGLHIFNFLLLCQSVSLLDFLSYSLKLGLPITLPLFSANLMAE